MGQGPGLSLQHPLPGPKTGLAALIENILRKRYSS